MTETDHDLDADAAAGLSLLEDLLGHEPRNRLPLLARGAIPERFDGLQLQELMGRGGMGEVYAARRLTDGAEVAVKVRLAPGCDDALADELLAREARLLAELDDPGIVRVHGTGIVRGRRYLVMQRLRGESLESRLARGLSNAEALAVCEGVARALKGAHACGVAHRDLSPANVFVIDGDGALGTRVRLLDFGIAGRLFDGERESGFGTWRYMAPEQRAGAGSSTASDVFALAVLLERMVDGPWVFLPARVRALHRRMRAPEPAARPGLDELLDVLSRSSRRRLALSFAAGALLAAGVAWTLAPIESSPRRPAQEAMSTRFGSQPDDVARAERPLSRLALHDLRLRLEEADRGGEPLSPQEANLLVSHVGEIPGWLRPRVTTLLARQGHVSRPPAGPGLPTR